MGRQQLRIIGGDWRGRKLSFPAIADLRPTSDRVRETLFNWLQMDIGGARCLDLFAGSGALGLEALSRGASEVCFVEKDAIAAQQIRDHLQLLQSQRGRVLQQDALGFLTHNTERFDIIFLDPPFKLDCMAECSQQLSERGIATSGSLIYIETPKQRPLPALPEPWQLLKQKAAGDVAYHLVRVA